MKITISKSQWEEMGRKAGWTKKASFVSDCCHDDLTWLSDNRDQGMCEECGQECGVIDEDQEEQVIQKRWDRSK